MKVIYSASYPLSMCSAHATGSADSMNLTEQFQLIQLTAIWRN